MPFSPLQTPKIKILKNENICWRYHHFTHAYQKSQSYDVWFLRYGVKQAEFFVILDHFWPLRPPDNPENQTFKIEKNTWRYYHFTHLHHKWQSYDVWFLRYGAQQTEFFVILDHCLPFYPTMDPENQNFRKWTTHLKILSFYKCVKYMTVIWYMIPEIWSATNRIFCHFGPFFALLSP